MRILIGLHQSLPRWLGGAEVYAHQLAQSLKQLGHMAVLFTRDEGDAELMRTITDGIEVYRCFTKVMSDADKFRAAFGHRRVEQAFEHVLNKFQPDVVNFHHLLGLSPRLPQQARRRGLPVVLTLQDYWYVCANTKLLTNHSQVLCNGPQAWMNCAQCGAAKLGPSARWVAPALAPAFAARDLTLRRVLRHADRLIAPSRFLAETYIRLGAPAQHLQVMEEGIQLPPLIAQPLRSEGPLRLLFIGSPLPMKGLHILIEAFNSLPMSAELTIVGDLNRDPAYTHRLRGLAMHSGVKWIGPVAHDGVWAWFDWSDVVVVPSLWYENAPLVIQEALAMRRPVIASRLGSLPEWVRDDADGVLYPAGDVAALRQVLSDLANDRRRLLGWHNQIKPVRTMQSMAEEMAVVYAELIAARRARHT